MSNSVVGSPHKCPTCGRDRSYSFRYDAFWCENCEVWLSPACDLRTCIFCADRPPKPYVRMNVNPPPPAPPHPPGLGS